MVNRKQLTGCQKHKQRATKPQRERESIAGAHMWVQRQHVAGCCICISNMLAQWALKLHFLIVCSTHSIAPN